MTPLDPERIAKALAAVAPPDDADVDGHHVASTPETVSWGWMPSAADGAVLEVAPGSVVCVDTVSHEGILGDQGRDPVRFFGGFGVPEDAVLADAAAIATATLPHDPRADGPWSPAPSR